jgi:hypothetical protein
MFDVVRCNVNRINEAVVHWNAAAQNVVKSTNGTESGISNPDY